MKQYPKYKDSGIQWIGKVPEHWEMSKIKYIASLYTGNSLNDSQKEQYGHFVEEAHPYVSTKDISASIEKVDYENGIYIPFYETSFKVAPANSILLCIEGGNAGKKSAYLNRDVTFVNKLCCIVPIDNSRYRYYAIQAKNFTNQFQNSIQGLIGGVSISELQEFSAIIPPLSEQQAIADYLDKKTSKIDEGIECLEQQKADLQKYRQSVISEAVTHGLDPNAKLKDSGIEWIGMIPEGWKINKMKYCCEIYGRIGFRGYTTNDMVSEGQGAITLSPSNIKEIGMSYTKLAYLSWDKYNESPEIQIHNGDVLYTKTGSSYGKSAYVDNLPMEATINPQLVVFKNFHACSKYIAYILKSPFIRKQTEDAVVGGTIPTLAQEKIINFILPVPPLSEQQAIADYLDAKTAKIDETIATIDNQITDLRNYRTALITEAVTGKVDVR